MMINKQIKSTTAFAPSTVANVAVGFDILGFAVDSIGDEVTLIKRNDRQLVIQKIDGISGLPLDPKKNVVTAVIQKVLDDYQLELGLDIQIKKGIPLGSGMGGSAASTVAALTALNGFFTEPLSNETLVPYAMFGEEVASGKGHPDNVVPSLYGGFTLIQSINPVRVIKLPVPENLITVLFHPKIRIDTKLARNILKNELPLGKFVEQSANLAGFISALYLNNIELLKHSLNDVLIEPHRSLLIPRFDEFKSSALENGALGCSISGSGPTMFALTESHENAEKIKLALMNIAQTNSIEADAWIVNVRTNQSKIISYNQENSL